MQEVAKVAIPFSQVIGMKGRYIKTGLITCSRWYMCSKEACERIALEISKRTGIMDSVILYITKEYEKDRVKYLV